MAKYMNMVGCPFWWAALFPGPLGSPLNPALRVALFQERLPTLNMRYITSDKLRQTNSNKFL